jgi:uroporphyrinogen decarboxylase
MGLPYELEEKKGPSFPITVSDKQSIDDLLTGEAAAAQLEYVYEAVKVTKQRLAGRVPLIGFSGAPWTLLAYMVEGSGSKTFSKSKRFLYTQPELAHQLLDKLSDTIISYLNQKVAAGVNAVQIFDSWAGILSPPQYSEFSIPYLKKICDGVKAVPKIIFPKDGWFALKEMQAIDCQAVGLDWTVAPSLGRAWVGDEKVLQGNLDPCALYAPPAKIRAMTEQMILGFQSKHIANLGHGLYPDTPLEGVREFVNTVKGFCY